MTSPDFPDPAAVLRWLTPSPSDRWCDVFHRGLDATAAHFSASHPHLNSLDTSPTVQETDAVSDAGLGLHTDGYSEVPDHPSILLLSYSRPIELRVLGVDDVVAALIRVGGFDVARRLATTEAYVDADLTHEKAPLLTLSPTGEVIEAVVSPVARSAAIGDEGLIDWWVGLWRDATVQAPIITLRTGHTIVIDNRRAAHARSQRPAPGLQVQRVWLTPAVGQG
ncbi:hypothetical protein KSP35_19620 [Aquihabitans sp. G128]|uniref:hypothetical protein n=1 Tax=Aquihabitans sp. G128 TaxID=2849779 RepID=UPI001C240C6E|nr:hypothetical protein [Aquihabitans sp. G128]QXC60508.1 hypothetical protein KSP35_19620 [Aquihabitans sp. G128]